LAFKNVRLGNEWTMAESGFEKNRNGFIGDKGASKLFSRPTIARRDKDAAWK